MVRFHSLRRLILSYVFCQGLPGYLHGTTLWFIREPKCLLGRFRRTIAHLGQCLDVGLGPWGQRWSEVSCELEPNGRSIGSQGQMFALPRLQGGALQSRVVCPQCSVKEPLSWAVVAAWHPLRC